MTRRISILLLLLLTFALLADTPAPDKTREEDVWMSTECRSGWDVVRQDGLHLVMRCTESTPTVGIVYGEPEGGTFATSSSWYTATGTIIETDGPVNTVTAEPDDYQQEPDTHVQW